MVHRPRALAVAGHGGVCRGSSEMTPEVYAHLDLFIRKTVETLNKWGFTTTDSGDGRLAGDKAEMEGTIAAPHVAITCSSENLVSEARRLMHLLQSLEINVQPLAMDTVASIQATFDPADDSGMIMLFGVDDTSWDSQ